MSLAEKDVLVRCQRTPNPLALKFITNGVFKRDGKATFTSSDQAEGLPLVSGILDIPGVAQVYLYENVLTLTHQGELSEETLQDQVISIIKTRLPIHTPDFLGPDEEAKQYTQDLVDRSHLSEEMQRIESILDRTIRPGLRADGGDVEVIEYKDDRLKILYQGACGGCPSAMMGTLDAIQNILAQEIPNPKLLVIPI